MKKRILLLLLVMGAVTGAWLWHRHDQGRGRELVLYGNVDIREVNLGFRVGGRVAELFRDEGDAVKAGELLARLDAEPNRRELEQATAQATSLRARLEMLESGYRSEEVALARATLAERQATLTNALRNFARQKELIATRAVSQQDYDEAVSRLDEARARVVAAEANLALQAAGFRKEEIAQAQADLAKAEASAAAAKLRVEDTELRAPSAGVVMTRAVEAGAIVQPGATAFTVSLEQPVWVRAYVDEKHLGSVPPGTRVTVFSDARPERSYAGQVGYVSPRAEFTPKTVETPELRTSLVYRLRIVVSDSDGGLRQGMPVTVKLAGK